MSSRLCLVAAAACGLLVSSSSDSFAQVVYQPVQYQHRTPAGENYLYGGNQPIVHLAAAAFGRGAHCGPHGYARFADPSFDGGRRFNEPSPISERERVFSDCVGTQEASWFGFTAADARNEAYANAPTYFRKADLLAAAIPTGNGAWVVPAAPPPASYHLVPARPLVRLPAATRTTSPSSTMPLQRGQILIVPKDLMNKKLSDFEKKPAKVAMAK